MAGRGPAPKAVAQRRNHHAPLRGEWVDLGALDAPVLPKLPRDTWSPRTKRAWESWRGDPATGQYGPADISLAIDLAYVYEQWVRDATAALAAEIRMRQDGLGLSPKGKQDRRWQLSGSAVATEPPQLAQIRVLKIA